MPNYEKLQYLEKYQKKTRPFFVKILANNNSISIGVRINIPFCLRIVY